jgi:nucleoside-diphosphate-sugar epimerase
MSTRRYVITGGGGFVGKALGKALRAQGHQVVSLSRGNYPELAVLGIETHTVDISSDPAQWQDLFRGADGVFHTAAKVDMWGAYKDFFATNVVGTRNIIQACRAQGVKNLVFTSSPSVVHNGLDLEGVDESYPYPSHFDAFYPQTKAQAEQEVLAASNSTTLKTVALRPHLIWGPNDTNLIPAILERARAGRLTRIGAGKNLIDVTFIDDCVAAHLRAMQALEEGRSAVYGKAYFITQGDPVNMWQWIDQVLAAHGLAPVSRAISRPLATILAVLMESVARVLSWCGVQITPLLTRFLVSEMSTHHYFSIAAARRDLGYAPTHTVAERMAQTFGPGQPLQAAGA